MKHTIEKIDDYHWKVDNKINIRYATTFEFGGTGWYVEIPGQDYYEGEDDFLKVLEEALKETITKKRLMPRGVE